jgi:hypothetical protein
MASPRDNEASAGAAEPGKPAGALAAQLGKQAGAAEAQLSKQAGAAGKQASAAASKGAQGIAKDARAQLSQLSVDTSSPAVWAVGGVLLVGLALLAFWLWRRRQAGAAPKAAAPAPSELDLYKEWRSFRKRLPARIKRVLDDFQPVILLGNTASEKERMALELSGVAEREREFPGKVVFRGEGLSAFLGSSSVVLVPSEAFLRTVGAETNASWCKLLRKVCAVRAPRVVVCLSQAPLDGGDLAEVTAWTSTLRRHIDLIVATRNEDIEVSVTLAQAPLLEGASLRLTDALFELISSLSDHEGVRATLCAPLAGLTESLSEGSEDRRRDGERWASQVLRRYRRGWPRLLAHPGQTAPRLLALAQLFEHFPRLSGCLGAALGELFVNDERQRRRGVGQELVLLPARKEGLVGVVAAFSGPRDDGGRWHPNRLLLHRLGVASGAGVLSLVLWLVYSSDKAAWDLAATAALRYVPPEQSEELRYVKDYLEGRMSRPALVLPEFFERDLLRCLVVDADHHYLQGLIDQAVRTVSTPETVLQLAALYLAGTPTDCGSQFELLERGYGQLHDAIHDNVRQWHLLTELSVEEIYGYLSLACPQWALSTAQIQETYSSANPPGASWPSVPSAEAFGAALESLSGACRVTDEEEDAIVDLEEFVQLSSDMAETHGAAYAVLDVFNEVNNPSMTALSAVFGRFRPRFEALQDLSVERDDLELLVRDVLPFSAHDQAKRATRPPVDSVKKLTRQLQAFMAGQIPEGEDAKVRMTFERNTFVVDRKKVRDSLLTRALDDLHDEFTQAVETHEAHGATAEALFFDDARFDRPYTWLPVSVMPSGLTVLGSVPRRYTVEGFQQQVLEPLEDMRRLLDARSCSADDAAAKDLADDLNRFVEERLDAYLGEYARQWQRVYESFHVRAEDDDDLTEVLQALTRQSSPQLAMLREVLRQTSLEAGEQSPFSDDLTIARAPFDTLAPAADEKAFAEYRALLVELANASQSEPSAAAPPGRSAAPEPGQAPAPSFEQSIADLTSGLTGFGRVVLAGLRDPKQDLRSRAHAWAQGVSLAPALRGALLEPFDAVYASGERSLASNLGRWWASRRQELERDVYWRFPFNAYGATDALVADVVAWLDPREGRFAIEVDPIAKLMNQCAGNPCVALPPSLSETVHRTHAIARVLFDDKSQPKPIALSLEPVPFTQQRFAPRRTTLRLDSLNHEYFNTAPRGSTLSIPWNEARVARLEVQIVGETGADGLTVPIDTESSPWAMFHLLQRASGKEAGRYRWELDVTGRDVRIGKTSVSYRVCQDVTLCNGLFTEALRWL